MQQTKILAIAAVAIMVVAAAIGLGYAFQAQFTDQISGTEETTGQFLKVNDKNETYAGKAINIMDTKDSELKLRCGVDGTKTSGAVAYKWDGTNAVLTKKDGSALPEGTPYSITPNTANAETLTIKVLYRLGAYDVTAPVANTTATIKATGLSATNTYEGTHVTNPVPAQQKVVYILTTEEDLTDLTATATVDTINANGTDASKLGPTALPVYLYALATWTVGVPTDADATLTLTMDATTPIITATASTYGS